MVQGKKIDQMLYIKSISDEIGVTKNRVRDLIGNKHWGKDGEFKESILRRILSDHLPNKYDVGTGFIIREGKEGELICSNQIDIIIYDNERPVLFRDGNFVILNDFMVCGIIEVKTSFYISKFENEFKKCCENSYYVPGNNGRGLGYKGLFYFDFKEKYCNRVINFINKLPNHWNNHIDICLGKNIFFDRNDGADTIKKKNELAYSYFLINALERICGHDYRGRKMIDLKKIEK